MRTTRILLLLLLVCDAGTGLTAAPAGRATSTSNAAAGLVYWSAGSAAAGIQHGSVDGSGAPPVAVAGVPAFGLAIDSGAGKIYWANDAGGTGSIQVANLDGSGAPVVLYAGENAPRGVALDATKGYIFWADAGTGTIRGGPSDGSGPAVDVFSGEPDVDNVTFDPLGVFAYPPLYWTTSSAIRVSNGSGGVDLFSGESGPAGIAIDHAHGRIYWADRGNGSIRVGNLDGTGAAADLFTGEDDPRGVAIDTIAGRIYWANEGSGAIRAGNLDGTGSPSDVVGGVGTPRYVAVMRPPNMGVRVSGLGGAQLSCYASSSGDDAGALLYQKPQGAYAYQWQLDGSDIADATQSTYAPAAAGPYSCRVSASNQAGSSAVTESPRDRIYVSRGTGGQMLVRNLDGSGFPMSLGTRGVFGFAIDPARGKYYAAGRPGPRGDNEIDSRDLDDKGSFVRLFPRMFQNAMAIDAAAGRLYSSHASDDDSGTASIQAANLDGSGTPVDLFSGESDPQGMAVDSGAGKIYWATGGGAIRVGPLDGSGAAADLFAGEDHPFGVAVDAAAGTIYWTDYGSGKVRRGNLDGSGAATDLYSGEDGPVGLALDPAAGRIYWANNRNGGAIRVARLDGTGAAADLFTEVFAAQFIAILRAPVGTGAPSISGPPRIGLPLACGQGTWAPDLSGAFLYRAPRAFAYQWQQNGANVSGATGSTYTPAAAGSYTCLVSALNESGSTSQTSVPVTVKADQTIAFGALSDRILGAAPFGLLASASSGLAVAFSSQSPAVCGVSGGSVTMFALGTCTIAADQGGDGSYEPAPRVTQSFRVLPDCSVVSIVQAALPLGVQGLAYQQTLTVAAGAAPVTWALTGALPAGVTFGNGVLSGTPSVRGAFPLTVTATDAHACQTSASLTLPIAAARRVVTGSGSGDAPTVRAFDLTATASANFLAYPADFPGGVSVAQGDTSGDGVADFITGAGPSGGPHVKVFDGATGAVRLSFFAFDPSFASGVEVAAGDINNDGFADVLVVGGCDTTPAPAIVRAFDGRTGAFVRDYPIAAPGTTCGFHVAAGDVNGDGIADLVVGSGGFGLPFVVVIDGATGATLRQFNAYDAGFRGGVYVAAADVTGDGYADIVTGAGLHGGPHVRVFDGLDGTLRREFMAYDPTFTGGVRVAAGDLNGDGHAEIVTAAGPGGGPHVRVFDGAGGSELLGVFAFDPGFSGGVFVAGAATPGRLSIDVASQAAGAVTIAGWALREGGSTVGVDAVHVWALPVAGGAPVFVGATTPGVARLDVAATFGGEFYSSGFEVTGSLAPGTYDLVVFARNSVTGLFDQSRVVRITVN